MRLINRHTLKPIRRRLRRSLTPAEACLWLHLQRAQLHGRKFRRQQSVGGYVVDFFCPSDRLAVELDGASHNSERAFVLDRARTAFLQSHGIAVLRFENHDVIANIEGVLAEIAKHFGD